MKALVCHAPGHLILEERPAPADMPAGTVLIDVSYVGICGTDYHIYEGKHPFLNYPRIMGHEVSGRVAATGDGVDLRLGSPVILNPYIACGKCVACRQSKPNCCVSISVLGVHTDGAMCEQILVPAGNLYPADGLSLRDAATVEFLAIGAHAVRRSMTPAGSRTLVIGAGPIGIGIAIFARIAGHDVSLLDADAERLAFATDKLGFISTIVANEKTAGAVSALTHGEGFDAVFDATGNANSIQSAFAHVAHGGSLVLVSVVKDAISFSDPEFHKREMMLIGSRNATREDFLHVIASIRRGEVPVNLLVTHETNVGDATKMLPHWAHEKTGLIKAVIKFAS